MKKLMLSFAILIATASMAQWSWEKIEGNGKLKKESRPVAEFSSLSSSGSWDVMIAYGSSNTIEVEGDENLLGYIETTVENGKLSIKGKKNANLRSKNKITIYVSMTKMSSVYLSGSGDIIGNGKFSNEGKTDFRLSGSGNIRIALNKVNEADLGISGSGNIRLAGSTNKVNIQISGSGNADCGDLISDDATVRISGSGDVKLNANRSVDGNISGSGNISYKGSATEVKKHVSGSGKVTKV